MAGRPDAEQRGTELPRTQSTTTPAPIGGFTYLPTPDVPGGRVGGRAIARLDGVFVAPQVATDEDYAEAASLSTRPLKRCRTGSRTWHWHRAVIAEHERRRRSRLTVLPGGAT